MSKKVETPGVPSMGVGEATRLLSSMYGNAIGSGVPLSQLPAAMLWGPPGVGKSQAVRQMAEEVARATGRRAEVTDVRLLLYNPVDLRGIPVPDDAKETAVWLRPEVFDMDPADDVLNVLLLDEITAASPSVQAAAYQIVLDRTCGEHALPGNCIVVAAGNRLSDRSVAYRMPKALANRLLHVEVRADPDSWRRWAVVRGVNPMVVAFLALRPDRLMAFDASSDDLAFPSPRSWEMASAVLDGAGGDVDAAFPLVAGLVGTGAASEFRTWARVCGDLPDMDDVFAGRAVAVPKTADALYALVSAMAAHARERLDDIEAIGRSIEYARLLPADFSVLLLKDYLSLAPGCKGKLMRVPAFTRWAAEKGEMLNGVL